MTEIIDGLWAGSQHDAMADALRQRNIRSVLCLDGDAPIEYVQRRYVIALSDGITGGALNNDEQLYAAVNVLNEMLHSCAPILVHCAMGMNRTVCVIAAWLVQQGRCQTIKQGIEWIERKGHLTHVHPVLQEQMERLFEAPPTNLRTITYLPVRDFTEHCNVCHERLRGDNSGLSPFRCSCGTWKYVNDHFEIEERKNT